MKVKSKFPLGKVVTTPGTIEILNQIEINTFIMRHSLGDWGEACKDTKTANDEALLEGDGRIFSVYISSNGEKIWIITEADRSVTTVLLPDEY